MHVGADHEHTVGGWVSGWVDERHCLGRCEGIGLNQGEVDPDTAIAMQLSAKASASIEWLKNKQRDVNQAQAKRDVNWPSHRITSTDRHPVSTGAKCRRSHGRWNKAEIWSRNDVEVGVPRVTTYTHKLTAPQPQHSHSTVTALPKSQHRAGQMSNGPMSGKIDKK